MKGKLSGLRPLFGLAVAGLLMVSLVTLPSYTAHAQGQGIALIRDTEAERVLRAKLDPILITAGLVPKDVQLHLVNDPSINAFVAEGQHMFINTGLLMTLDTPNQITGVMAHETGHMAHGDLDSRLSRYEGRHAADATIHGRGPRSDDSWRGRSRTGDPDGRSADR